MPGGLGTQSTTTVETVDSTGAGAPPFKALPFEGPTLESETLEPEKSFFLGFCFGKS